MFGYTSSFCFNLMDYSIRIPATTDRSKILETKAVEKIPLSRIKDYLFKPQGTSLKDFHPGHICIRLREFLEGDRPASLAKITTTQTDSGYTDQKEKLGEGSVTDLIKAAESLGYEKWGEFSTVSTQYTLQFDDSSVQVLSQELSSIGTFLKIESETQAGLDAALKLLNISASEAISKNAAVLLAEHLSLI